MSEQKFRVSSDPDKVVRKGRTDDIQWQIDSYSDRHDYSYPRILKGITRHCSGRGYRPATEFYVMLFNNGGKL